jgi:CheY-like chemotaxis protein
VQGRVVFTGREFLVWSSFSNILKRYIFRLRDAKSKEDILDLERQASPEQLRQLGKMLTQMEKTGLVSHEEVVKAVQTHILCQFDHYLFQSEGVAQFTADQSLVFQAQIPGFKLEDLLARATQRRMEWRTLLPDVPSMECQGTLNDKAFEYSNLTEEQKRHIKIVISRGKTFEEIAYNLAKDPLEIAKLFAKLSRSGLVKIEVPVETKETSLVPTIFVVDDSPVLLQQFENLVVGWGYRVKSCLNPSNAVRQMLEWKPRLIFLDINMPGVSGFDLIKQIRRETELSSIPLVLLTAEKSVSNQWRAQWANCKFLAKPSAKEEVPKFRTELMEILRSDAPIQENILG